MTAAAPTPLLAGGRIDAERRGAVVLARLFNPPAGLMDDRTEAELHALLDRVDADPGVRVVVLTGRDPGVFVRHYDVALLERRGRAMAARGLAFSTDRPVPEAPLHKALARIDGSDRIFVAAINGTCMGGGYELALACDLRYAQRGEHRIGLPEVNIGLLPGAGGTQRLPRLIGPAAALEALLLGRTFAPDAAAAAGLVHGCVDDVLAHALGVAAELAARPARSLAHVKRLVRQAADGDLERGLADERTLFCELMSGAEALQRMSALVAGQRDVTDGR